MSKNGKPACVAPWIGLHIDTTGIVKPCCVFLGNKSDPDLDNVNHMPIEDAFNSKAITSARADLLNNKIPNRCSQCFNGGHLTSMREWYNNTFTIDEEPQISAPVVAKHLDIRYRNLCNLKCTVCGPISSSSWWDEGKNYLPDNSFPEKKFTFVDVYDKIEEYLGNAEFIYFAGGEPLLFPEHMKTLQYLLKVGNTSVHIKYNTNMTTLKYKGVDLLEYWKQFPNVSIEPSLDSYGTISDHLRTGSTWETLEENVDRVVAELPNININIAMTLSNLNFEMLPEFCDLIIEKKWMDPKYINPGFVVVPKELNMRNMPQWYKDKVKYKLSNYGNSDKIQGIQNAIEFLSRQSEYDCSSDLYDYLEKRDEYGGLKWREQLPHIREFFDENKI